jgi:hypothetical protein
METNRIWAEQYRKVEFEGKTSSSLQRSGTAIKDMIQRCERVRRACDGSGYRT